MIKIKRLFLIIGIILAIIFLSIFSLFYLKNYTEKTSDTLETITQIIQQDKEKALKELEKLCDDWNNSKNKMGIFIHEERIEEVSDHLDNCYAHLDKGNTESFLVEAEETLIAIEEFYEKELPTIQNIL